jgi:hypothetical protein
VAVKGLAGKQLGRHRRVRSGDQVRVVHGPGRNQRTWGVSRDMPPNEFETSTPSPTWVRRRDAVALITRGVTFHTASRVALVVGTLLTVVNQGEIIWHGEQTAMTWLRVVFNYAIPYVVASIGYLAPLRRPGNP